MITSCCVRSMRVILILRGLRRCWLRSVLQIPPAEHRDTGGNCSGGEECQRFEGEDETVGRRPPATDPAGQVDGYGADQAAKDRRRWPVPRPRDPIRVPGALRGPAAPASAIIEPTQRLAKMPLAKPSAKTLALSGHIAGLRGRGERTAPATATADATQPPHGDGTRKRAPGYHFDRRLPPMPVVQHA